MENLSNIEKYLKPTHFCESDSSEIKKLVNKITKGEKDKNKLVISIFEWVRDNVSWNLVKIVGAKKLLEKNPMEGVCVDKTNLFIALCRAKNIPARYLFLKCSFKTKKGEILELIHMAAEVFIKNKWIIADTTFGKNQRPFPISKLGKPIWIDVKWIKRWGKLPLWFTFFGNIFFNFYYKLNPNVKKFKEAIKTY